MSPKKRKRKTDGPEGEAEGADIPIDPAPRPGAGADVPPAEQPAEEERLSTQEQLEKLNEEVAELQDRLLRKQAEIINYRRRVERDRADYFEASRAEVIKDLLPLVDDLERAVKAEAEDADSLREGVALILRSFEEVLGKMEVERIDPRGEAFDPTEHEALGQKETEEVPDGHVVEVHQPGYRMKDRLLRPAMVVVAKSPAAVASGGGDAGSEEPQS